MYVSELEVDRSSLQQGDIIHDIQLFGALNYAGIHHTVPSTGGDATAWSCSARPLLGDAMVLSHSCELAKENGIKVTSIILAPLRDVSNATPADKLAELIASNRIDQSNASGSYLKYFYLEPSPHISFAGGALVDFSKCFSVRNKSYEYLIGHKSLQLKSDVRESMALKLALYFHRAESASAA